MEENKLHKNILKYIFNKDYLDPETYNFNDFSIINFDYKMLFPEKSFVTNNDLLLKFFETIDKNDIYCAYLDFQGYIFKTSRGCDSRIWKAAFIFFMVIPFTDYEYYNSSGHLINPDNLTHQSDSKASENILVGTFSKIKFNHNSEMPILRFENNLKNILNTELRHDKYTHLQIGDFIRSLLKLRFYNNYSSIKDVTKRDETEFRDKFKSSFEPICCFVASLLNFEISVSGKNSVGPTGVQTKVPHQTNDLFYAHPDICAYLENETKNSLVVVEVKKIPLLTGQNILNFDDSRVSSFHIQLLSEMFSNRKNKGILTDSNKATFIEINISKVKTMIEENEDAIKSFKEIPLNYRLVDSHSSGLTLTGALTSFIYESFKFDNDEDKAFLYKIYQYVRKSDPEYLEFLTNGAKELMPMYKSHCKLTVNILKFCRQRIQLDAFEDIDIQSGFYYNSQIFKVTPSIVRFLKLRRNLTNMTNYHEVVTKERYKSAIKVPVKYRYILKVFDPFMFKKVHGKTKITNKGAIETCRRAYSSEMKAYEILSKDRLFNSLYVNQEKAFGTFYIGEYYHAMGPFIILKYIDPAKNKLPKNRETYKLAREQLQIVHANNILHGDIKEKNILYSCSQGNVFLIDFGYSRYDGDDKLSRPSSPNPDAMKSEHIALCDVFEQPYPTDDEWRLLIMHYWK